MVRQLSMIERLTESFQPGEFFLYEELETIFPDHPKSSIMARVWEAIHQNSIKRVRLAKDSSSGKAIYQRL